MCKKVLEEKKREQLLSQMINTSVRRGKPPVTLTHSRPFMPPSLQNKCRRRVDSVPLHPFENIIDMVYQQWIMNSLPQPWTKDKWCKRKTRWSFTRYSSFFSPMQNVDQISNHAFLKKVIHITAVKLHISYLPAKESLHIISITGSGVKHHSWNRGIRGMIGAVLQKFQNARGWRCIKWFVQNRVIEVSWHPSRRKSESDPRHQAIRCFSHATNARTIAAAS